MEELVSKYIELRDVKAQLKSKFDQKVSKIDAVLDRIESAILAEFTESGVESCRTKAGTAYKQVRSSAGVADWERVLQYIQQHELWHMLERRVNKSAVEQFKEANGDLPPGVNWREEVVINVRRSS
jgi:chromosome segregation ATPase